MIQTVLSKIFPENNRIERIWLLARVDFKKRYNDSVLGLFWALINPILRVAVYYFAFSFLRSERFDNFALYLFSGLITWLFFTEVSNKGMSIIKQKRYLIENIQFEWLDIFVANILTATIGYFFNLLAYFIFASASGIFPGLQIIWFPFLFLNLFLMAFSFSLFLASISIHFDDIKHLWNVITLAGMWTAPIIIFTIEELCEVFPILAYIHPITAILVNVRNAIMYNNPMDFNFFVWGWVYAFVMFVLAILFFDKNSKIAIEKL